MRVFRRFFALLLSCLLIAGCTEVPPGTTGAVEYHGQLNPELASYGAGAGGFLKPASGAEITSLGAMVPVGAQVQVAQVIWKKDARIPVYLVTPPSGDRFVLADGDGSGGFEQSEKAVLELKGQVMNEYSATLTLVLDDGPVANYDLEVTWVDFSALQLKRKRKLPEPYLSASSPLVEGEVDIKGRKISLRIPYSFETASPGQGMQEVDANYDGEFDRTGASRERALFAVGKDLPIFRIDDTYVSVTGINLATWQITLTEQPAEAYRRIELEIGNTLPDFEYVDLDGNPHRLSDLKGTYVLVDVWGTWCKGCIDDLPHHRSLYAKYRARGFEILSLDDEHSDTEAEYAAALQRVKKFVVENGMVWPQANEASVRELIRERLIVHHWPTTILVDPEREILWVNTRLGPYQDRAESLDQLLEALFGSV
jgi:peroxiredoxin